MYEESEKACAAERVRITDVVERVDGEIKELHGVIDDLVDRLQLACISRPVPSEKAADVPRNAECSAIKAQLEQFRRGIVQANTRIRDLMALLDL